jgi:tetrahydromethanopterin S-methyltransferase subunit B
MASGNRQFGGIGLGGIIVIAGILVMVFWSFWIGLIIGLIGLIAFGGFVKGKWY